MNSDGSKNKSSSSSSSNNNLLNLVDEVDEDETSVPVAGTDVETDTWMLNTNKERGKKIQYVDQKNKKLISPVY